MRSVPKFRLATPAAARLQPQMHRRILLAEGALMVILGLTVMAGSLASSVDLALLTGWVLLGAGSSSLVCTIVAREAPGFAWSLTSALLAIAGGLLLVTDPFEGLITLTLLLTVSFIADGIFCLALAATHRRAEVRRWQWLLANGLLDVALAAAIIAGMPEALNWGLGLLVDVDLLIAGASLIAMALAVSRTPKGASAASLITASVPRR